MPTVASARGRGRFCASAGMVVSAKSPRLRRVMAEYLFTSAYIPFFSDTYSVDYLVPAPPAVKAFHWFGLA
jgi:hypothetical protein